MGVESYDAVISELRKYRDDRDWTQFHGPKDLAIAVSTEAGELLEHFLWRDGPETAEHVQHQMDDIAMEIADVATYLIYLCDSLKLDLLEVVDRKRELNLLRHPVAASRGRARRSR
jgi:dCTP diphosphatase